MADKPKDEGADAPKPKGKKMLVIILAAVVLLVVVGGGGAFWFLKQKQAAEAAAADAVEEGETVVAHKSGKPKHAPEFLPMDNLVVNLADPGGARFAQVGLTIQVEDKKASDLVKGFMPAVRSGILLLLAKRSSVELLAPEGKEKLAAEMLALVREKTGTEAARGAPSVVQAVLFSNFIVQ